MSKLEGSCPLNHGTLPITLILFWNTFSGAVLRTIATRAAFHNAHGIFFKPHGRSHEEGEMKRTEVRVVFASVGRFFETSPVHCSTYITGSSCFMKPSAQSDLAIIGKGIPAHLRIQSSGSTSDPSWKELGLSRTNPACMELENWQFFCVLGFSLSSGLNFQQWRKWSVHRQNLVPWFQPRNGKNTSALFLIAFTQDSEHTRCIRVWLWTKVNNYFLIHVLSLDFVCCILVSYFFSFALLVHHSYFF
jgi:hypothetical protein